MMIAARQLLEDLRRQTGGNVLIEAAIVAPTLLIMSLGGFEVSRLVARQHELQSGAAEATAVALAANQGAQTDTVKLKELLRNSLDLDEDQVTVTKIYRCDASEEYVETAVSCQGDDEDEDESVVSTYVRMNLTDTYSPIWSQWGIHHDLTYNVERTVQLR